MAQWGANRGGAMGGAARVMGGAISGLPGMTSGLLSVGMTGIQMRLQRLKEVGAASSQMAQLSRFGVPGPSLGANPFTDERIGARGRMSGMTTEGVIGQLSQFAQARGLRGGLTMGGMDPFRLSMRTGIGMGQLGQFAGMAGPGGGMTGNLIGAMRVGGGQGLRGAGMARYVQQLAGAATQLASKGMKLDTKDTTNMLRRMQATPGLRGTGALQPQIVTRATGMAGGAIQQLIGGMAGFGQAKMIASAAQGGGGLMGTLKRLEEMQATPSKALGVFGGGMADRLGMMAGLGVGTEAAAGLGGLRAGGGAGTLGAGMMGVDRLLRVPRLMEKQRRRLAGEAVRAGPKSLEVMLDEQTKLMEHIMQAGLATQEIVADLGGSVDKIATTLESISKWWTKPLF
jgi:hypothetical protein